MKSHGSGVSEPTLANRLGHIEGPSIVWLVAGLAGVVAVAAGAEPTGLRIWDGFLVFGLTVILIRAAAAGPRWGSLFFSTTAMIGAGMTAWSIVGFIGLAIAVASSLLVRRSRVLAALACACSVQLMFRWSGFGFFGLPSLISGVAIVVILVLGYRYASKGARKRTRRVVAVSAMLLVVVLGLGAATVLQARPDAERGLATSRQALDAVRDGDPVVVAEALTDSADALGRAQSAVDSRLAKPLLLIPIVSQHYQALSTSLDNGVQVTQHVAGAVSDVDLQSISLTAGAIDLPRLVALEPQLVTTADLLDKSLLEIEEARSGWLLPLVDRQVAEGLDELGSAAETARLTADGAAVIPAMLGADGPRRYFVMFGTPAEAREFGGLLGSWGLIEFDAGRVEFIDSGRIFELRDLTASNTLDPTLFPDWFVTYGKPQTIPQNLTGSPNPTVVREATRALLNGLGGASIDGVVYLDAVALIPLLELTGPVSISIQEEALTNENAAQFFFEDQYRYSGVERTQVFGGLADVASAVLDRMADADLPGPERLGSLLGPAARAGHLQVTTFDERENDFLRSVRLLRDFGGQETEDFLGLVHTNFFGNKLDLFLTRSLDYTVELDGNAVAAEARVELVSDVPEGLPEYMLGDPANEGWNKIALSLYTSHFLRGVTVDGVPVPFEETTEFGLQRYVVEVLVPPDARPVVVLYDLAGAVSGTEPYSVEFWRQPLTNDDDLSVKIRDGQDLTEWQGPLTENVVVKVD